MNNEEAIRCLRDRSDALSNVMREYVEGVISTSKEREEFEALDLALEALEKQVPKSPIITDWNPARCPCCDKSLSYGCEDGFYKHSYSQEFCSCGQKLKWN